MNLITLVLIGVSMTPVINNGDRVVVDTTVQIRDLRKGDVVTWKSGDKTGTTTHTVFEVHDGWVWTKGVANVRLDSQRVTSKNLVGKVVRVDRVAR